MPETEPKQQITLYVPEPIHREFRVLAAQLGERMNDLFLEALSRRMPEFRRRAERTTRKASVQGATR